MNNLIIVKENEVNNYKHELQEFFIKIQLLFKEIKGINNSESLLLKLKVTPVHDELTLKNNKTCIDIINNTFKSLENINNDIKKTLNTWKSNFAGINGLDTKIKEIKESIIKPFKLEQLKYDELIKNTKTLKEQSNIKTTIGIKTYKEIILDELDINKIPLKYLSINESLIKKDIKENNNININGVKFRIIEIKK